MIHADQGVGSCCKAAAGTLETAEYVPRRTLARCLREMNTCLERTRRWPKGTTLVEFMDGLNKRRVPSACHERISKR